MAATDKTVRRIDPRNLRPLPGAADLRALCRGSRRAGAAVKPRMSWKRLPAPASLTRAIASRLARTRASSPPISTSRCSTRRCGTATDSRDRLAAGRCAGAAVRRCKLRCRRLPVRRDVLSRQGPGLPGGAPGAEAGRTFPVQCMGPDCRKRICRRRHRGAGRALSRRSARFMARTPHGYLDVGRIRDGSRGAGFTDNFDRADGGHKQGRLAPRCCDRLLPRNAAAQRNRSSRCIAPRRGHAKGGGALAQRFGSGPIEGRIRAHVITAE